ncbi:MAG: Crp/Fnr family transcriptional regulator [Rhodoferax sp.]|nr:Crp/Fnr family transcriptional regulator [Rhodoferax sp.]
MSILSHAELIRRVPLFTMITSDQSILLSEAVTKRRYKRGEAMVEQGAHANALVLILAGRARVVMTDRQLREVILATLRPGDYLGEMSLIDSEPHSASVVAEIQTDALVLGRSEFERCLNDHAPMAQAVMRGLVLRLRQANEKISSLALLNVYERVAKVLMGYAIPSGDKKLVIRDKMSRQDIAKMVGASREMVSRVMRDFEEQGFIEISEGGLMTLTERRASPR